MKLYKKDIETNFNDGDTILLKDTPDDFQSHFLNSERKFINYENKNYKLHQILYFNNLETYVFLNLEDEKIQIVIEKTV